MSVASKPLEDKHLAPAIEINGLGKKFGSLVAVDNLTLEVNQGEIFGLLGPNGSGKTTTINLITGLIRPTAGSVSVLGFDVGRHSAKVRSSLAWCHKRQLCMKSYSFAEFRIPC